MEKAEVSQVFINILETTPGVYSIQNLFEEQNKSTDSVIVHNVSKNIWDLTVAITILQNSNLKNIVTSISSALRFALRKKGQKLGKLNILVGGLSND